jgi:hypothetical protein
MSAREYDKKATVQTGPGLPRWAWNAVSIGFSGPVQRDQTLSLWLIGPVANMVLALLRVALLALLLLCAMGFPGRFWPPLIRRSLNLPSAALAMLVFLGSSNALAEEPTEPAALPSPSLLEQLRARLEEAPECAPSCASISRLALEATPTILRMRLEILAGARTAIALPGHAQHWLPLTAVLDGKSAAAVRRSPDGQLWLAVNEGTHQLLLEGPLPSRETVQLALPLKPHQVTAKLDGWTVHGLYEDGVVAENLELSRVVSTRNEKNTALQTDTAPAFVRVQRALNLGLNWSIQTTVQRLTPTGSAVVLEVPLFPGESVTSSEIRCLKPFPQKQNHQIPHHPLFIFPSTPPQPPQKPPDQKNHPPTFHFPPPPTNPTHPPQKLLSFNGSFLSNCLCVLSLI